MFYPAVLHQEGESAVGAIVPDLPGCFSAGDTLDEAIENLAEAIDLHLEGIAEDGDDVPVATSIEAHRSNPEYADGIWVLIPVDITQYLGNAQRINISLPHRLIHKIDRFVDDHSEYKDRSKFLADAALKALDGKADTTL